MFSVYMYMYMYLFHMYMYIFMHTVMCIECTCILVIL